MEFVLSATPLCSEQQTLCFDKIAILIGENGSGKSLLLESIFMDRMNRSKFTDYRIVCFSSGQNESFSESFKKYLNKERELVKPIDLNCFYFDKSFSKLLIFLSTSLKTNGLVRSYLRQKAYVVESGDEDVSSKVSFKFTVPRDYVDRVKKEVAVEERGEQSVLLSTPFFRTLASFIETYVDEDYDFEDLLSSVDVDLTQRALARASYFGESPRPSIDGSIETLIEDNPVVRFYLQASEGNYFINRQRFLLQLKGGLELEKLSDGEYQLLFVYSLIDLFDSSKTLFLFDEADSHLHFKNLDDLWKVLRLSKGYTITTTHLLDTVATNEFDSLNVVNNGKIDGRHKLKKILERIDVLSCVSSMEYQVCAKAKHVVLIDDCNDWDIFIRLARRKGLDVDLLDYVYALKKTSGYANDTENFAKAKIQWVETLFNSISSRLVTSNIFLICDKDNATLSFDSRNGVKVNGPYLKGLSKDGTKVYLLAWKRREIKYYLLSYTALKHHRVLSQVNNDELARASYLKENSPCDSEAIQNLPDAKKIVDPFINKKGYGLCLDKLQRYIDLIPPDEISEDIVNMYNFILHRIG